MAQTKRRRRTKHRGNAAGVVETRGRTGRPPTAEERKASQRDAAHQKRVNRYDRPPTWKGAFNRALIAAALMLVVALLLLPSKNKSSVIVLFPIVMLIYVPFGYYTDQWFYRRRQRQKAAGRVR